MSSITYPPLPSTLLLISTKAYFTPSRTIQYLTSLLDPANNIVPLPPHVRDQVLFGLIPDFLTIQPCSLLLLQHASQQLDSLTPFSTTAHIPIPTTFTISLGAQDCSASPDYGAHTGSVPAPALASLGVTIVELGHAERRAAPLHETDALTAAKAAAVCANGMIPLVCVGERERPPASGPLSMAVGNAVRQLRSQVVSVLEAVPPDAPVILAYEPVWAIGAAEPAGVEFVGPVVQGIRELVKGVAGRTGQTRVVYGGSAGPGLWSGKKGGGEPLGKWVDGMFLGRFAHETEGVKKVVDEVVEWLEKGGRGGTRK